MKILRKLSEEKGSITMTVIALMLFVTGSILIAYFSLSNQSNNQSKKIKQISDSYKVTNRQVIEKYKELYDILPYTPVDYIQSTGTQYIDAGINPNQNTKVNFVAETEDTSETFAWFGSRNKNSNPDRKAFVFFQVKNNIKLQYGETNIDNVFNVEENVKYTINWNKNEVTINGNSVQNFVQSEFQSPDTLIIFSTRNSIPDEWTPSNEENVDIRMAKIKLYSCKIWNDNILVRDFIPVLNKAGVPCLYDKVEEKFYYNQGEGEFLYGNE